MVRYLQSQLKKLNVNIQLGKEATASAVEEFKPDVVVLATGVKPLLPRIPGLDKAHGVQAGDVLEGKAEVGNKVVIIGGELVGCETAEYLAEQGKKVIVARRGPEMALAVGSSRRSFFLNRLAEKGVTLLPGVTYDEVSPSGLVVTTQEGERRTIEADTIVLAAGAIPDNKLYDEVKGKLAETYLVGDCAGPRTVREAIADSFRQRLIAWMETQSSFYKEDKQ